MGDYSDNFIGIDDEFYGGGGGGSTRPLDTLLENMIDSSTRWLVRRRHLATQTMSGGDRTYASLTWMAIAYLPIKLDGGVESITVTVPATISDRLRESEGGTTNIQARLRVQNYGQTVEDWSGDGTLQKYDITHTLDEDGRGQTTLAFLEILSEDEGQTETNPNFDGINDYWLLRASASATDLEPGDFITDGLLVGEPIAQVDFADGGTFGADSADTGWPLMNTSDVRGVDINADDFRRRAMGYIQPRGFVWSATQTDTENTALYTVRRKREMMPNEAVLGRHTSRHQRNIKGVYERPEIKAVGPQAVSSPNATWGDLDQRWPTAYVDGGDEQSLGGVSFMMDRDAATIELNCWFQFCHVVTVNARFAGRELDLMRDYATLVDWTINAEIQQLTAGGIVTYTSIATASESLTEEPHWIAGYNSPVPILQQAFYSYYHQDGSGSDGYMWFEGSLIPERGDLSVMVPVTLSMDIDKADMGDFDLPAQAVIDVSPDTSSVEYELGTLQQDTDRLQCRLIAMSVAERGSA